ncbi:hypothetical protein BH09PAT3_BH09PAT3_5330 [soil metagenome]
MQSQITLIRAIGSEFIARKLKSTAMLIGVVMTIAVVLVLWLTTISAWWWLLAVPVISTAILALGAYCVGMFIVKLVRPNLTAKQKTSVHEFVDKLERVADNLQTPMFIIVFRVIRDVIRPRDTSFIRDVATDSTTLHSDFMALQRDFS